MHIKSLHIDSFKCLQDFEINFDTDNGGSAAILIGENGTGKSSMMEMIIRIFMSIYSLQYNTSRSRTRIVTGNYLLEYTYASKTIKIQMQNDRYNVWENDNQILANARILQFRNVMRADSNRLLPMRIISFYSGMNASIQRLNELIYKNYKKACFDAVKCYLSVEEGVPYMPTKHFIYCSDYFTQVYLCSFLCCNNQEQADCLRNPSGIQEISRVKVFLNTEGLSKSLKRAVGTEDVERTLEFLDSELCKLFQDPEILGTMYSYSILKNRDWGTDAIDILDFFDRLQTIFDAQIDVEVTINNIIVSCDALSEGQRQLIKMVGMLGLCRSQDTLVLLDEPDAHMNPRWKYDIFSTITEVLKPAINTQAIIATHDPLVINGVSKEYIRIFERDTETENIKVFPPDVDTEGMGIDGLLQSEYYGLKTSYDKKTTEEFVRRQELYEKLIKKTISDEEKEELRELTRKISSMPISSNSIDFLYDDFISVFRKMDLYSKEYLSFDQIQERKEKIKEIIRALYEGQV